MTVDREEKTDAGMSDKPETTIRRSYKHLFLFFFLNFAFK